MKSGLVLVCRKQLASMRGPVIFLRRRFLLPASLVKALRYERMVPVLQGSVCVSWGKQAPFQSDAALSCFILCPCALLHSQRNEIAMAAAACVSSSATCAQHRLRECHMLL